MDRMTETLFTLKMTAKQLEKLSKKAEKEEAAQKALAIERNNIEGARIYAENAIRKKNEALNFLRLSSRVDGVQSRVKTAMAMKQLTKDMGMVTKALDQAMSSMNLAEISAVMEKFEKQFEALDVHAGVMEGSMAGALTLSAPEDQIEGLIKQVADENSLEIATQLDASKVGSHVPAAGAKLATKDEDDLSRRLAQLRS